MDEGFQSGSLNVLQKIFRINYDLKKMKHIITYKCIIKTTKQHYFLNYAAGNKIRGKEYV